MVKGSEKLPFDKLIGSKVSVDFCRKIHTKDFILKIRGSSKVGQDELWMMIMNNQKT